MAVVRLVRLLLLALGRVVRLVRVLNVVESSAGKGRRAVGCYQRVGSCGWRVFARRHRSAEPQLGQARRSSVAAPKSCLRVARARRARRARGVAQQARRVYGTAGSAGDGRMFDDLLRHHVPQRDAVLAPGSVRGQAMSMNTSSTCRAKHTGAPAIELPPNRQQFEFPAAGRNPK